MKEQLISIFEKIIEGGIIILAFLLPLFFLPITTDFFEFPKQLFLFFVVGILTVIWLIKMILERSIRILHNPLTVPILVFLGAFSVSTILSVHRFSSIFGPYPRLHGGLVSLVVYILIFFLIVSNIKEKKQIYRILTALSVSGFLLAIIGILNFFDISILGDFLRGRFVTPVGSADRASLFLVLLLPISLLTFFFAERKTLLVFSGILSFIFIFYIFLISVFPVLLSVFLIFLIALIFSKLKLSRGVAVRMGVFFLLCLLLLVINNWSFVRSATPLLKDLPIQHDIALEQDTGWAITAKGFQNLKILALGSGPGTYLFDFTTFKPVRFNQTSFWNLRFEKSSNEYFHITSTLGILGLIFFVYILIVAFRLGREFLRNVQLTGKESLEKGIRRISDDAQLNSSQLKIRDGELMGIAIFSTLFIFAFISLFVSSFTLTAWLFWLFLALMVVNLHSLGFTGIKETEFSLAMVQHRGSNGTKVEILPWLIGFVALLILIPLFWQEIKILNAELHFARAQAGQRTEQPDANLILQSLVNARDIVPSNDTYRRALSATSLNFAILAQQENLLSEKVQQQLLLTAKREGEFAVQSAPHNIFNWENIQRVYTLITLENQDDLLINNVFPQEILLDPANPRHRNDLGWAYFNLRNDTELAKRNFQDAISLKPDFPDAHYNLARVYKEEGKKDKALQEYEQTLNFINQQIASIEGIASLSIDLQRTFNQLIQFKEQIEIEKTEIQPEEVEQEEVEQEEDVTEEE